MRMNQPQVSRTRVRHKELQGQVVPSSPLLRMNSCGISNGRPARKCLGGDYGALLDAGNTERSSVNKPVVLSFQLSALEAR